MRKLLLAVLLFSGFGFAQAQSNADVEYLESFSNEFTKIQEMQVDYTAHLVHGKGEVVTQKRQELKDAVVAAVAKVEAIPTYENDKGLKKAALETFKVIEEMTNKDYSALIEQKAGCVDCFEAMEVEYQITEQAADEANKALSKMNKKIDAFAKEYNIKIVESENELEKTLAKLNRINDYLQQISMSVSQCSYADAEVAKAFASKDLAKAEAAIKKMKKENGEAQKRFKSIQGIPDDAICIVKARSVMEFYDKMANEMYPDMINAFDKKAISRRPAQKFSIKILRKSINNCLRASTLTIRQQQY